MNFLDLPTINLSKDGVYRYCWDPDGFCWAPEHGIKIVANGKVVFQRLLHRGHNPEKIGMIDLKSIIRKAAQSLIKAYRVVKQCS